MGLATIDPHSHSANQALQNPEVSKIQPFENAKIYKEMYGHPDAVRHRVRMPYIPLLILTFLNRCISVKTSLINTKLGDFVNLGVLFLTM